jgi:transposase
MQITTIGLDLAKHWFQVHGVDADGRVVVRRRLWRSGVIAYFRSLEPCLVWHGSLRDSALLSA